MQQMNDNVAKQEADKLAKDLNSKDPATQNAAKQKLGEMLKDPKNREAVKRELDKAKQNAGAEAQKNIDDAVHQAEDNIAKSEGKSGGQPSKEDIDKLANDLNSKDPVKQQAANKKLQQMLGDPKQNQAVKNELENIKNNTDDATAKKNIDDVLKAAEKSIAKKDGKKGDAPKIDPKEVEKLVKDLQSKDPKDIRAAEKMIEEIMKDPAKLAALEKQLDEMMKDPKQRGKVQKAIQDFMKNEIDKLADQLQNGTPDQQKEASRKIEELLNDPKNRNFMDQQFKEFKKNLKDEQARKTSTRS